MKQSIGKTAFLGTGLMGSRMARNLLAAGHPLTVWNRHKSKADSLAAQGAVVADSAATAVNGVVTVITMLANGPVVDSVLFGPEGAAAKVAAGALVIDMSSAPPDLARIHAERFAARGIDYLDAPVSGGTVGAEQGNLAIMAGGTRSAFERAAPIFAALGRATLVGPAGSGQLAKLANQAIVAVTIGAVAEALLLTA